MEDNKAEKNEEHFLEASVEFTLKEFKEENVEKASNSSFPDENSGSDFEKELWDHPSVRGHLFWHISFRENNQLSDKKNPRNRKVSILTFFIWRKKNQWLWCKKEKKNPWNHYSILTLLFDEKNQWRIFHEIICWIWPFRWTRKIRDFDQRNTRNRNVTTSFFSISREK